MLAEIHCIVSIPIIIKCLEVTNTMQILMMVAPNPGGPLGCILIKVQLSPQDYTLHDVR